MPEYKFVQKIHIPSLCYLISKNQDKKEKAVIEKYGVKNIQQCKAIKDKSSKTKRSLFYDKLFTTDRLKNKVVPLFDKNQYISGGYYSEYLFECINCKSKFSTKS